MNAKKVRLRKRLKKKETRERKEQEFLNGLIQVQETNYGDLEVDISKLFESKHRNGLLLRLGEKDTLRVQPENGNFYLSKVKVKMLDILHSSIGSQLTIMPEVTNRITLAFPEERRGKRGK